MFHLKTQAGWHEKQYINHTSEDGSMTPPKQLVVRFVKPEDVSSKIITNCWTNSHTRPNY